MSDQGTPQQPSNEERSSSQSQQERERARGNASSSGGAGVGGGERSRRRHRRPHNNPQPRQDSSLNMEELRELMELFTEHGLTEFEFERDEFRIHLGRNPAPASAQMTAANAPAHDSSHASNPAATGTHSGGARTATPPHPGAQAEAAASEDEDLHIITSPIVGTFYRSPSPTAEPFIRIGSRVEHDTVVCIIEAMKLMNEIQAETGGEVVKIYVENAQPVEYGQPLFGIKK